MIKHNNKSISSVYDETTSIGKIMKGTLKVYESWRKLIASGVPPITLLKCKGRPNLLPSGYQQVEYIEATGSQYINSNFYPDSNTAIEIDFLLKPTGDNKNNFLFGVNSNTDNTKRFALNLYESIARQQLEVYPRFSTNAPGTPGVTQIKFEQWYNFRLDKGKYYIDNVLIASYSETFEKNEYLLYINAYNSKGSVSADYMGNTKIKSCKIWDNGVLVRNYIPCYRKSDNVIGMYDLVENKFYTNAGTGVFIKGINITTGMDLVDYKIYGESKQESKNAFDINTMSERIIAYINTSNIWYYSADSYSVRVPVKPNTTYKISTENEVTIFRAGCVESEDIPSETLLNVPLYNVVRQTDNIPITMTTTENTKYLAIQSTSATIEETLKTLKVIQQAPTPEAPIEIESVGDKSKNLLNINNYTITGNPTFEIVDGHIIARCDFSNRFTYKFTGLDPNKKYTFSFKKTENSNQFFYVHDSRGNWNGTSKPPTKVTPTADGTLSFVFATGDNGQWFDYEIWDLQLEEGSAVTEYEPYGKYKIPVTVSGKNIIESYGFSATGILTPTSSRTLTNNYGTSISSTNFESSLNITQTKAPSSNTSDFANGYFAMGLDNAEGDYILSFDIDIKSNPLNAKSIRVINQGAGTSVSSQDIQLPSETKGRASLNLKYRYNPSSTTRRYLEFRCMGMSFTISNIMLTKLNQTVDYEPRQEPITTNIYLNEPLRKINDYADYIDFEKQKVFRNVEVLDYTGTLSLEESLKGVIDDVGTNIELPNIPTHKGTTIIDVDTNILPSNMEVVYLGKK